MTADDLTFGVELEVTIPIAARHEIQVGGYHCGRQIRSLPAGWNAQNDSSIHADNGFFGVEIVSPILKGADGLKQVKAVCEWLQGLNAKVNSSTGFHVHVGFDRSDLPMMKKLVALVARHEKGIYASTGTHRREASIYCQGVRNNEAYRAAFLTGTTSHRLCNRYHILNIVSNQPTVEFRFTPSTSITNVSG